MQTLCRNARLATSQSHSSRSLAPFTPSRRLGIRAMATAAPFYSLSAKTLQNEPVDFASFQGKPVLIVNVASQCGFTSQYKGLQALYDQFKDKGLVILGFPCNQFGGQEPGGAEEIATFCQRNFGVTFPIMEKVDVNGPNAHPVFQYLKSEKKQFMMENIKWNFEKFLIDRDGNVAARYSSVATPEYIAGELESKKLL